MQSLFSRNVCKKAKKLSTFGGGTPDPPKWEQYMYYSISYSNDKCKNLSCQCDNIVTLVTVQPPMWSCGENCPRHIILVTPSETKSKSITTSRHGYGYRLPLGCYKGAEGFMHLQSTLADLGGVAGARPQRDPILLFSHTFSLKSVPVRGRPH